MPFLNGVGSRRRVGMTPAMRILCVSDVSTRARITQCLSQVSGRHAALALVKTALVKTRTLLSIVVVHFGTIQVVKAAFLHVVRQDQNTEAVRRSAVDEELTSQKATSKFMLLLVRENPDQL